MIRWVVALLVGGLFAPLARADAEWRICNDSDEVAVFAKSFDECFGWNFDECYLDFEHTDRKTTLSGWFKLEPGACEEDSYYVMGYVLIAYGRLVGDRFVPSLFPPLAADAEAGSVGGYDGPTVCLPVPEGEERYFGWQDNGIWLSTWDGENGFFQSSPRNGFGFFDQPPCEPGKTAAHFNMLINGRDNTRFTVYVGDSSYRNVGDIGRLPELDR